MSRTQAERTRIHHELVNLMRDIDDETLGALTLERLINVFGTEMSMLMMMPGGEVQRDYDLKRIADVVEWEMLPLLKRWVDK